ncbi:FAD-dependent oxidoreductase [Oceanidesulfovibrio marinus]|uniref:CoA-disulfide reductase n=1 Tax=Oceanidesulfovibrio marinus TaxID=370038 RepID=A0ABX6NE03_9BACT|nr:FAD-dependent oxidoreductase [Oceanidesulfovibrio marinus]QJT07825.1 CoA-disulfide reductase [Oceanidesulfovibrio marinus]
MRFLIIGGSDAGISAALRARQLDDAADVTLLLKDDYPNYSICGLPFLVSGETPEPSMLAHRTRAELLAAGIRIRTGTTATRIDPQARTVTTVNPAGHEDILEYDACLVATGAESLRPPIEGLHLPGVFTMRWMEDGLAIREFIEKREPRSAVIVGSGYIGLEMADALTRRGIKVFLAGRSPSVLKTVDEDMGSLIAQELVRHGVSIFSGVAVESIQQEGSGLLVLGRGVEAYGDMVLVATGATPSTDLAQGAGASLGAGKAIAVNQRMETGVPGLYAAGDCVETYHRLLGKTVYLPLGTTAHKQGRIAGENAVGGDAHYAGTLGTQAVKVFDLVIARTGLNDHDATLHSVPARSVDVECTDHKAYYPGATPMHVRITGNPQTGALLGAQIVGSRRAEVAKRVDICAAAIHAGQRVDELTAMDLSYTPPLSSPWDPVQVAAQAWCDKLS